MKDTIYLVVGANGVSRMTKRQPSLYRNEVGVRLQITLPDACFRSLTVSASLDVPPDRIIEPVATIETLQPELSDDAKDGEVAA